MTKSEKLSALITSVIGKNGVTGATIRIEQGNGQFEYSHSVGDIGQDAQYFIASTTKIYTTAIIMKLRSEGHIDLDSLISEFFTTDQLQNICTISGRDYSHQITVRQLLAHTSGLADYFQDKDIHGISLEKRLMQGQDEAWNLEKVLEFSRSSQAKFIPGTKRKAHYSDTNYQLLGGIVEKVRGTSLAEVFQNEIFTPLALKKTFVYKGSNDSDIVQLRYKDAQLLIPKAMSSFQADGGIVSTTEESMTFIRAFFNGKFFPKDYISEMTELCNRIFFPLQYGVGVMKFELPRIFTLFQKFPALYGHSGLSGAFEYYAPDLDIYLTGTVNQINNPAVSYQMLIKALQILKSA
jgi:CubicO group peptidase (beta-lactamase class C family)